MKNNRIYLVLLIAVMIVAGSCTVSHHPSGSMPPGQAKKAYGTKSAKPFAPGQQKKN